MTILHAKQKNMKESWNHYLETHKSEIFFFYIDLFSSLKYFIPKYFQTRAIFISRRAERAWAQFHGWRDGVGIGGLVNGAKLGIHPCGDVTGLWQAGGAGRKDGGSWWAPIRRGEGKKRNFTAKQAPMGDVNAWILCYNRRCIPRFPPVGGRRD